MTDFIKKAMYVGLGLAGATKERVESVADDIANQTRMSEEEGRKFAEHLKQESGKAREELQDNIRSLVDDAMDRVPTLGRIRRIERRLEALEVAVGVTPPEPEPSAEEESGPLREEPQAGAAPDLSDAVEERAQKQKSPRK